MRHECTWADCAKHCEESYGVFVDWEEEYFICPVCDKPIYANDWGDHDHWHICPICEFNYIDCSMNYEDECEDDEEDEEE